MKTILLSIGAASFIAALCAANLQAAETNTPPARIGIYDSRAVAYAHFSTAEHLQQINKAKQAAQAVRDAGQTNHFQELAAVLRQGQEEIHREVFSTAPASDAMAALKDRLPEIQKEAGVSVLVSKWDDAALKKYPDAGQVDVTDRLVREFKPTARQLKVISGFEKSKPLPLDECNELIRKGEI